MMIFMLAIAMTVAMLIATFFALHHETQQLELKHRAARFGRFGPR